MSEADTRTAATDHSERENSEEESTVQEASDEEETRGSKRSAPDSPDQDIKASSANDWEHANLGDHGRKNKFLRLMGASKKEHGKFVIGDKERASDRTGEIRASDRTDQEASDGEEEEMTGSKRSAPDSADPDIQVSSANDWEHANLGDHGRKNKFLRLMGASKKEHHGKFVIGDKERASDRTAEQTSHESEKLEHQFEQSLAHKLQGGRRSHIGFGFDKESPSMDTDKTTVTSSENTESERPESTDSSATRDEKSSADVATAPESSTHSPATATHSPATTTHSPAAANKYAKFGFVKSS